MNMQEYEELKSRYDSPITHEAELIAELLRFWAFMEFDAALEEYWGNQKDTWEQNKGRDLFDVSVEEVEHIIDRYMERDENEGVWQRTEMMRDAILDVTGLIC